MGINTKKGDIPKFAMLNKTKTTQPTEGIARPNSLVNLACGGVLKVYYNLPQDMLQNKIILRFA